MKGRLVEPERQVAASPQACLVGRPVRHPPALLWDAVTADGIVLERHASDVAGLPASGYLPGRLHAPTPMIGARANSTRIQLIADRGTSALSMPAYRHTGNLV